MACNKILPRAICLLGSVTFLAGCVTQPAQPPPPPPPPNTTVYFYPARGQTAEQQDRDKYECNNWAVRQTGFDPSAPNIPPHLHVQVAEAPPGAGVATGAVAGGLLGAAVSPPWRSGQGAILGAVAGALIGGAAQASAEQNARNQALANASAAHDAQLEEQAANYRRAMAACLAGRGYNVR